MATLKELQETVNATNIEEVIATGIIERIAADVPELTDFSPGSPHIVISEANAWGSALALFYAQRLPEAIEEWILRGLFGATERPAQPATANMLLTFSTPAPAGGRTIRAGTGFKTPTGLVYTLAADFTFPPGTLGNERLGEQYIYLVPVTCDTAGTAGNVGANIITIPTKSIPDLVSVTNPEPASGGRDTETYAELRTRFFRSPVDTLLVSQPDYEAAVREELGGGMVYVISPQLPDGQTRDPNWEAGKVKLAIIYPDGTPLVNNPTLRSRLEAKSPLAPVEFVEPTVVTVDITVDVTFETSDTNQADLDEALQNVIRKYLDPNGWEYWGQIPNKVWRSELVAAMQNVPGVIGISLTNPDYDVDLRASGWSVDTPYAAPVLGTWNAAYHGV